MLIPAISVLITLHPFFSISFIKWGFEISKDCELWHEQGLISKGDDIADYYFNLTESFEIVKTDAKWNQEEYEMIFTQVGSCKPFTL